jgi:hypothetical protein
MGVNSKYCGLDIMPIEYEYTYDKSCFVKDYPSRTEWDLGNNLMYDDEEDEKEEEKPPIPESRVHPPLETTRPSEAPYTVEFSILMPPENYYLPHKPAKPKPGRYPVPGGYPGPGGYPIPGRGKREDMFNESAFNPVYNQNGHQVECTAVIIDENWAITAAHCRPYVRTNQFIYLLLCFYEYSDERYDHFWITYGSNLLGFRWRRNVTFHPHPYFFGQPWNWDVRNTIPGRLQDSDQWEYDIALLKIIPPFAFLPKPDWDGEIIVNKICLGGRNDSFATNAEIYGYGLSDAVQCWPYQPLSLCKGMVAVRPHDRFKFYIAGQFLEDDSRLCDVSPLLHCEYTVH